MGWIKINVDGVAKGNPSQLVSMVALPLGT